MTTGMCIYVLRVCMNPCVHLHVRSMYEPVCIYTCKVYVCMYDHRYVYVHVTCMHEPRCVFLYQQPAAGRVSQRRDSLISAQGQGGGGALRPARA